MYGNKYSMFLINPFIYGGGGGSSYLVDDYSPIVAYSVDKLSSTATVCCRVRRASDNAEQDFGFSGNRVDVTAIETFVGTGNKAFITKIYNQGTGGSTYDITQTVAADQPTMLYSSLIPEFFMSQGGLTREPPMILSSDLTFSDCFSVCKLIEQNTLNYIVGIESPISPAGGLLYNGSYAGVNGLSAIYDGNIPSLTGEDLNEHLGYFNMKSSKMYISKDGASETDLGTFATSLTVNRIGGRDISATGYMEGYFKEMIFFNSDESANKTAIETNINDRFSIY